MASGAMIMASGAMIIKLFFLAMSLDSLLVAQADVARPRPSSIFVFGDSDVAVGNGNKTDPAQNQPWRYPYGINFEGVTFPPGPGLATGRWSDGRILTDFFASLLGFPSSPTPYASVNGSTPDWELQYGVNFAVGGAGVFPDFGSATFLQQVDQLSGILSQHPSLFSPAFLADSVVLLSGGGNDYAWLDSSNTSALPQDFLNLAELVVQGLAQSLHNLYKLGFRNFAVANLSPQGCSPVYSGFKGLNTTCNQAPSGWNDYHNLLLSAALAQLQATLPGSQFLELDLFKGYNIVFADPYWNGVQHPLIACCRGVSPGLFCGDLDAQGKPLYTLCVQLNFFKRPFFFDDFHLTQRGWQSVFNLLYSGLDVTKPAPNVLLWINSLTLTSNAPSKQKDPAERLARLRLALIQSLEQRPRQEYTRFVQILKDSASVFNSSYLANLLDRSGQLTVFLPTDEGFQRTIAYEPYGMEFLARSPPWAASVAFSNVLYGLWPASKLVNPANAMLTVETLGGLHNTVGVMFGSGSPAIVHPNLFKASWDEAGGGTDLLVHGVRGVFFQPATGFNPAYIPEEPLPPGAPPIPL